MQSIGRKLDAIDSHLRGLGPSQRGKDRERSIVVGSAAQHFFEHADLDVGDSRLRPADEGALADQPLDPLRPARHEIGSERLPRRLFSSASAICEVAMRR
jgi:hypothetical protein